MFFLKSKTEPECRIRGVSEITVRPEVLYESEREFQDVRNDFRCETPHRNDIKKKTVKGKLKIFNRHNKADATEIAEVNAFKKNSGESDKVQKKRGFFFRKSNVQTIKNTQIFNDHHKSILNQAINDSRAKGPGCIYSEIHLQIKPQNNASNLESIQRISQLYLEDVSPNRSSPHVSDEASISDSFSWRISPTYLVERNNRWHGTKSPSSTSVHTSDTRSSLEESKQVNTKEFVNFRKKKKQPRNCNLPTQELNQMISLVANEELLDPWVEPGNLCENSDDISNTRSKTVTRQGYSFESLSNDTIYPGIPAEWELNGLETPSPVNEFWVADFSNNNNEITIREKDPIEGHNYFNTTDSICNGTKQPIAASVAKYSKKNKRRPRSWFKAASRENLNVFHEAQILLDILHETFSNEDLDSPDSDLRTV